jgi:hypothetical protein
MDLVYLTPIDIKKMSYIKKIKKKKNPQGVSFETFSQK